MIDTVYIGRVEQTSRSSSLIIQLPAIAALLVAGTVLSIVAGKFLPYSIDWETVFRPAALAISSGRSPYQVDEFFAAPWGLLALIPVAHLAQFRPVYILLTRLLTPGHTG
jgi:hypothetical protein